VEERNMADEKTGFAAIAELLLRLGLEMRKIGYLFYKGVI
jgi:hypothetical protein